MEATDVVVCGVFDELVLALLVERGVEFDDEFTIGGGTLVEDVVLLACVGGAGGAVEGWVTPAGVPPAVVPVVESDLKNISRLLCSCKEKNRMLLQLVYRERIE